MKTHYAGEIIHRNGNVLQGWAACCSGEKAVNIRAQGNHTLEESKVDCKACLKMIQKHKDFAPEYARIKAQFI